MNIAVLASQAISFLAERLTAVGAGMHDAAEQETAQTLYTLLRERLSRTELGKTVLDQLQQQPQDPARQQVAAAVIAEQAQADPEFARMLQWSVSSVVQQGNTGQVVRHQPVNVTPSQNPTLDRPYISAGDIDNRRTRGRSRTVGLVLGAILVVAAAVITGVVVGTSDDVPDPASIGTDVGDAGVRQTAEAVRDAYTNRDTERLCALSSIESQRFREGTEKAHPPSECPPLMSDRANQLPLSTFTESRTLAVENVRNGADRDDHTDDGVDENEAKVILVNRDPQATCQQWELKLIRENGRWVLDLNAFATYYLDPDDDPEQTQKHCSPPEEPR